MNMTWSFLHYIGFYFKPSRPRDFLFSHFLEIIKKSKSESLTDQQTFDRLVDWMNESCFAWKSRIDHLERIQKIAAANLLAQGPPRHYVKLGDADYPKSFYQLQDPPFAFTFVGTAFWSQQDCISIVGSREPTETSRYWMDMELRSFLSTTEVGVISGGARGVDQQSHLMAIRQKRPTGVVLPSGLGQIYPDSLLPIFDRVLETGGAFISEYPESFRIHKALFHHRNRLIAVWGAVLVIIEARDKSGTLMTANHGAQLGKTVLVVPGHPSDIKFSGSLKLLMEGATMICHANDLNTFYQSEIHLMKY